VTSEVEAVVVGAGAAGLAAAHALVAAGREVVVLEAQPRAGGVMQSEAREGFLWERGPNTFRLSAAALAALRTAGVEAELVKASPASRARWLLGEHGLVPVPMSPLALARTRLLTGAGKRRLLREPFVARGDGGGETVAAFIERRLGREALAQLVAPFLTGVYAGDEAQLGAEAVFPSLVAAERASGSIARGLVASAWRARGAPRGRAGSWSGRRGLGGLADALARVLGAQRLRVAAPVHELAADGRRWRIALDAGDLRARSLVVATDAPAAAKLLGAVAPEAARFCAGVRYAPIAAVPLDVDPAAVAHPLDGFGFLVPRERGLALLGALFLSALFPGRAPAGRALVHCMLGGARWPAVVDAGDGELVDRAIAGLDRGVGLRHAPRALAVARWTRAVPQPGVGHPRAVRAARASLAGLPPLALAGAYLDGVSVSDTLASGARAGGAGGDVR
jgi:oxygen-dependent protoporphyrinogen oxidase